MTSLSSRQPRKRTTSLSAGRSSASARATTLSRTLRSTMTRPTYNAADRALATAVKAKLSTGVLANQPSEKERVMDLLATLEASQGSLPTRVPDPRVLDRARTELTNFTKMTDTSSTSESSTAAGASPIDETKGGTVADSSLNAGPRHVKLSWDYPAAWQGNITGFRVYHEGEMIAQIDDASRRSIEVDIDAHEGANAITLTAIKTVSPSLTHESTPSNTVYSVVNPE